MFIRENLIYIRSHELKLNIRSQFHTSNNENQVNILLTFTLNVPFM